MISYDFLLNKLKHYGIRGIAWVLLFLKIDAKQDKSVNVFFLKTEVRSCCVPQCSVLVPLLFLVSG